MREKIRGIYGIKCCLNEKLYVGFSKDIYSRWVKHKSELRRNRHTNDYLQNSWNLYGEESFKFIIIEKCNDQDDIKSKEIYYIALFDTLRPRGFNLTSGGEGPLNPSEETLLRKSKARKGKKHTEETKKMLSELRMGTPSWNKGKKFSDETKERISVARKGLKIKGSSSIYIGVRKGKYSWRAYIKVNGKNISLGSYDCEEDAAIAFNHAQLIYFPDNPLLNDVPDKEIIIQNKNRKHNSTSKYWGVRKAKNTKAGQRWCASICFEGKNIYLGYFKTEKEAAEAYNAKSLELFGDKGNLNIIVEEELCLP
jgi:group I intron endonuclease